MHVWSKDDVKAKTIKDRGDKPYQRFSALYSVSRLHITFQLQNI